MPVRLALYTYLTETCALVGNGKNADGLYVSLVKRNLLIN
jgi:hypothetical protein